MKPVTFGILSTAKIAQNWVIPAIQKVPLAEVTAISSRDQARAAAVAKSFGIPRVYDSLEEMLADQEIEAIYIPTPNSSHVREAIQAARAGKHVLCEKPLGISAQEAEELAAVQRETGVLISEAFMVRYHPRWLAAREIIRSGKLGRVTQIHATYSVMNDNPDDIRFQKDLGGGALMDVGLYPITAARFLFEAEPKAVTATFEKEDADGVDIAVAGLMEFPDHRNLLFSGALKQAWAHWIMVTGTKGWMEIPIAVWPDPALETEIRLRGTADLSDTAVEIIKIPPANQYEHEITAFAKAIRGEISLPWSMLDAVASMRALDAVKASADNSQRIGII
ncbi:Gfo/Idh/MocA family protein [Paracoccus aminophilus]|uniref:Glucose-fructose oxidoreductase n=1 Tax=Paracoccus aminophilus JCM 7686 TaxID=1367847 RepID=S5YBR1_PARAH|nr:Gfo/Idh/MocA family oxidoreductase [Paracoccus aminophilus]AGT08893.1 glucose-fructose oxidoreductase [Paracoccus aminophilus JCM 7686]